MLGNDIVDLKQATTQSNWRRKGYLAKIFNTEEQAQILSSAYPDQMIWLLWSMKEAVYKIINRKCLQRFYNPLKFSCEINENRGIVIFESGIYYTKSVINENLIHTIASIEQENLMLIKTYYAEYKPKYLIDFNAKSDRYFLAKNAMGIPSLFIKKNGIKYEASISHHGKYLAICFRLRKLADLRSHFFFQKFPC